MCKWLSQNILLLFRLSHLAVWVVYNARLKGGNLMTVSRTALAGSGGLQLVHIRRPR